MMAEAEGVTAGLEGSGEEVEAEGDEDEDEDEGEEPVNLGVVERQLPSPPPAVGVPVEHFLPLVGPGHQAAVQAVDPVVVRLLLLVLSLPHLLSVIDPFPRRLFRV